MELNLKKLFETINIGQVGEPNPTALVSQKRSTSPSPFESLIQPKEKPELKTPLPIKNHTSERPRETFKDAPNEKPSIGHNTKRPRQASNTNPKPDYTSSPYGNMQAQHCIRKKRAYREIRSV